MKNVAKSSEFSEPLIIVLLATVEDDVAFGLKIKAWIIHDGETYHEMLPETSLACREF